MGNELAAAYGAVGANGTRHLGASVLGKQGSSALTHRIDAGAIRAVQELAYHRPAERKFLNHYKPFRVSSKFLLNRAARKWDAFCTRLVHMIVIELNSQFVHIFGAAGAEALAGGS